MTTTDNFYKELSAKHFPHVCCKCKSVITGKARKIVHVNGNTASLLFFIMDSTKRWIPLTGTNYMKFNFSTFKNLPEFIKRHIDVDVLQDYTNQKELGNYSKYPFGLYFENQEIVNF
ncbi:MAG: hypothetical protein A2X13_14805 [Bacteroidetes bacterium GWC2_33_15]|nr:MAG: hypothetical protein A2X10_06870 [Bacteroidetes bacterium GWA2_33_15]OFX50143.1 MAG: hypothetical protein A2X13_14805 [Bacteroidetes bacterium GWC2_33_15]OFX65296.1 MAG: hypothetical protein A2X15_04380 [Bacteroidetes bacterium GWB2_32_14]OFX70522.1 MAG: hypothetical protein A2X14_04435 [Bacteroidetes bacterium GWD2_33_33]HAN19605.1 hypothetical protein [Bacteroidales bacterium]